MALMLTTSFHYAPFDGYSKCYELLKISPQSSKFADIHRNHCMHTLSSRPLQGVRVVEFGQFIAAPGAAMTLADLGADVIKVEALRGDSARRPDRSGKAPMFLAYNRRKRSVALDLRSASGAEAARRLALSADVVLHNTRVGVMEAVGLDAASLRSRKPSLIHASINGFGSTGPSRTRPGLDIAAQAESGIMSITGEPGGSPLKVGFTVVDAATALATSNAILAALFRRAMQGTGDTIEISLLAVGVQLQAQIWAEYACSGALPVRIGNCQPMGAPAADVIAVADGHIVLSASLEAHWIRLCKAIGQPDLVQDPRFLSNELRVRHRRELLAILHAALCHMGGDAARALLERHEVVVGVVRNYRQVMDSLDVQATGIFTSVADGGGQEIRVPGLPFTMASVAADVEAAIPEVPRLGQHTAQVLAELGYASAEIVALEEAGAIGVERQELQRAAA